MHIFKIANFETLGDGHIFQFRHIFIVLNFWSYLINIYGTNTVISLILDTIYLVNLVLDHFIENTSRKSYEYFLFILKSTLCYTSCFYTQLKVQPMQLYLTHPSVVVFLVFCTAVNLLIRFLI